MESIKNLEDAIKNLPDDDGALPGLIMSYYEDFGAPHVDVVLHRLTSTKNSEVFESASRVIRRLELFGSEYWARIIEVAEGVDWDDGEYARISALSALGEFGGSKKRISKAISLAVKSSNPSVRDAVALAAQAAVNVPAADRVIFGDYGNFINEIASPARKWISDICKIRK